MVISGATSGDRPSHAELTRIFFLELKVVGSTMGTKDELEDLLAFCAATGVRPVIDEVLPLDRAREGFERMADGRAVREDRAPARRKSADGISRRDIRCAEVSRVRAFPDGRRASRP
ncbi:hypothetical protein SMICM304S_01058 [Streptomyces microflavus]